MTWTWMFLNLEYLYSIHLYHTLILLFFFFFFFFFSFACCIYKQADYRYGIHTQSFNRTQIHVYWTINLSSNVIRSPYIGGVGVISYSWRLSWCVFYNTISLNENYHETNLNKQKKNILKKALHWEFFTIRFDRKQDWSTSNYLNSCFYKPSSRVYIQFIACNYYKHT